jgi:nucleotide-binding universal stress UspA family protein
MKNIVVPTDFSIKSYNALITAKKIARKAHSTIHIVHVLKPILGSYSSFGEAYDKEMNQEYVVKLVEKVGKELENLKNTHTESSFNIEIKLLVGDPFKDIQAYVKESKADLVIIGDKGVTDAEEFFLGSLTDKVIRSITCPVITMKMVADDEQFDSIVYATDLKEDHKTMMNLLLAFQDFYGSTIHLVKINSPKKFKNDIDTKIELQKLVDKYEMKNCTLNSYSHEDEEYGIVYFADQIGADLIAIGVHEKSGFRRLISGGSMIDKVKDHKFRPVLTYRFDRKVKSFKT